MKKLFALMSLFLLMLCTRVYAGERYIVKLKDDAIMPYSLESDLKEISSENNLYTVDEDTAKKMQENGMTEYIEEDVPIVPFSFDDTYASSQTYLQNAEIEGLQKKYGYGKGVRVAVIDSGVNLSHEDLKNANIETGYNFLDNNTDVTDNLNHGTSVMGILCATPNNGKGIAGIAPEATYVPLVVMDSNAGTVSNVISAIYAAVDTYNCKVMNISAGTKMEVRTLNSAVQYAAAKGAIIVCASGNYGTNDYCYPAAYDSTISVGAVDSDYTLASYTERNTKVDVVTEGEFYVPVNSGGYSSRRGTSFSSPVVAGIAALLVQKNSNMTLTTFRNVLKAGTIDILQSGKDYAGYGYVKALSCADYLESDEEVFISPIYETSSGLNVKMFANSSFKKGSMVLTYFNNSRFSGCDVVNISTSDGVYYKSVSKNSYTSDELHIFAIEDVSNLRAISDKNILKY